MQPAVSRILIHTHLHSRKDFMANYTPKKVHPHKISLVCLFKSPLGMDFGGGEYARPPKIHSPLEDPEASTDIQRYAQVHSRNHSYGGTSIGTEAGWSCRREGIPHAAWRMECRERPYMLIVIYIHIIYPV